MYCPYGMNSAYTSWWVSVLPVSSVVTYHGTPFFVVTQVIHQFSTCQFPLLWVLISPFPFTDSFRACFLYQRISTAESIPSLEPPRVLYLTYWQVVLYPCLPELIWHRHLRLHSVSSPLVSRPQLLGVSAKGENTCPHVTGWSPWRDNVKHDSSRESRKVSHHDRARAFRRRKVIHTNHLSEFNVKERR